METKKIVKSLRSLRLEELEAELEIGKNTKCSMDANCEDFWNQPYPEEEGGK